MMRRHPLRFIWSFPGQVLLISGFVFACCVSMGLVIAVGLMKVGGNVSNAVAVKPSPSPWGRELKVAQRAFSSQNEERREPWGVDEIRWFVAANFKGMGPAENLIKKVDIAVFLF